MLFIVAIAAAVAPAVAAVVADGVEKFRTVREGENTKIYKTSHTVSNQEDLIFSQKDVDRINSGSEFEMEIALRRGRLRKAMEK